MEVSCVIKIGGSLFDLSDLPARLEGLLSDFARPYPVALCGGGPTVDLIRRWDRLYALGEEASHWIALRALTINALVAERAAGVLRHVTSSAEFDAVWRERRVPLLDAHAFIRDVDCRRPDALPRRWRVTSDSIAARMAVAFGAPELILLKSAAPEEGWTAAEAARRGLVDPHFPVAAAGLPRVIVINLRDDPAVERPLLPE
jgi:aspartokinase-like uncharacterized kinase